MANPKPTSRVNVIALRNNVQAPRQDQYLRYEPWEPKILDRVRFTKLQPGQCKWPYGSVRHGNFAYCGEPTVGKHPYCPGHCRRAYQNWRNEQ